MSETFGPIILICSFKDEEIAGPLFIKQLLEELESSQVIYKLVLVDDGSTDRTSEFLRRFVGRRVKLLSLRSNIGKISAQSIGAQKYYGEASDLVFFDGDGQHHPLEIIKVIKSGQKLRRITIGQRSSQYKRRFISRLGIFVLNAVFKTLGINTSLQSSELVFVPAHHATSLLADLNFGFLPINLLLAKREPAFISIEIYPRINSEADQKITRHTSSELIRKGLVQVYSEPLKMLQRLVILGLFPVVGMFGYGFYIGITQLIKGDPTGTGSIIVILSFSFVSLFLLVLTSFSFLIVINEWLKNRAALERELK